MAILSRGAWGSGFSLIQRDAGSNPGGSPIFFFFVGTKIRVDAARFSSILQYTKGFQAFSMGKCVFSIEIA